MSTTAIILFISSRTYLFKWNIPIGHTVRKVHSVQLIAANIATHHDQCIFYLFSLRARRRCDTFAALRWVLDHCHQPYGLLIVINSRSYHVTNTSIAPSSALASKREWSDLPEWLIVDCVLVSNSLLGLSCSNKQKSNEQITGTSVTYLYLRRFCCSLEGWITTNESYKNKHPNKQYQWQFHVLN